jgi:hypothetical protein
MRMKVASLSIPSGSPVPALPLLLHLAKVRLGEIADRFATRGEADSHAPTPRHEPSLLKSFKGSIRDMNTPIPARTLGHDADAASEGLPDHDVGAAFLGAVRRAELVEAGIDVVHPK